LFDVRVFLLIVVVV